MDLSDLGCWMLLAYLKSSVSMLMHFGLAACCLGSSRSSFERFVSVTVLPFALHSSIRSRLLVLKRCLAFCAPLMLSYDVFCHVYAAEIV